MINTAFAWLIVSLINSTYILAYRLSDYQIMRIQALPQNVSRI